MFIQREKAVNGGLSSRGLEDSVPAPVFPDGMAILFEEDGRLPCLKSRDQSCMEFWNRQRFSLPSRLCELVNKAVSKGVSADFGSNLLKSASGEELNHRTTGFDGSATMDWVTAVVEKEHVW